MAAATGSVIGGKYRLQEMLGKGGMGAVYTARHVSLDGLFAIKFLTPGSLERDEAHARFRREARAAATLTNEHVAKVCDVGVHEDELYIVMEHLTGQDLGAVAKERGVLPVGEAAYYGTHACAALEEAHEHGIVHRDVKLANLFVTQRLGMPFLKVLDFGIAKTLGVGDMTRTAAMLGSPRYMSPEQMNDPRSVDGRSDIWSLGVVLYRLVTGKMPFDGETLGRICVLISNEDPTPVRTLQPSVPPEFAAIVERCLDKNRERRFQTVTELAVALAPFASYEAPAKPVTADRHSDVSANRTGPSERVVVAPAGVAEPGNDTTWSNTESSNATLLSSASAPVVRPRTHFFLAAAAGVVTAAAILTPAALWRASSRSAARNAATTMVSAASPIPPPAAPTAADLAPTPAESTAALTQGAPASSATLFEIDSAQIAPPAATPPAAIAAPIPAPRRAAPPPQAPARPAADPGKSARGHGIALPEDRR